MADTLSSILGEDNSRSGPDRRSFLKLGAVGLIGAAGGSVWWAERRGVFGAGTGPAYEPWTQWSERVEGEALGGDVGLALVAGGILAANPHNSQPWLFRVEAGRVDILADLSRNLGPVDPFLRELFMGLGCAVENLEITAGGLGLASELQIFPDPDDLTLVARLTWEAGPLRPSAGSVRELFEAIPLRHTNRGPFDVARRIPSENLQELRRLAETEDGVSLHWIISPEDRARFGDLVVEATQAIVADPDQSGVTGGWLRQGPEEIHGFRDGLTLDAMGMGPVLTALSKVLPSPSQQKVDEFWLQATRDRHVATADVFGVLSVADPDSRAAQVACGRAWQRIHLGATAAGIAMHPLNQIPERDAREAVLALEPRFGTALREWVGAGSGLLCFRAGFPADPSPPSPRRSVAEVVSS